MPETTDIVLPYRWAPRPRQQRVWDYLRGGGVRASLCWHRRLGKDELALRWTSCAAHLRVGSYWHMLPEQAQARKAIWTMVNPHTGAKRIDEAFPLAIRKRTNDQEMFIEFLNGSTWQVVGSDNFNSLVGSSPCGIVFSEYALANPASWAYLRPIVRENKGWALFLSTPRGRNHFYNLHQYAVRTDGWFGETLTVEDTQMFTAPELAEDLAELQAEHGDLYGRSIWMQENYCSFESSMAGAIWAEAVDRAQLTGRIVDFDLNKKSIVDTAWDLGRTDDTSVWFRQFNGSQMDVIDQWASPGMDIDNPDEPEKGLVQMLLRKRKEFGLTYGTHWLPHDARPRTQAAGGKSMLQQFRDAAARHPELGRFAIVKRLDLQEGIQAARKTFPRCRFHATRCAKGLQSLRHYHRAYDHELKTYTDHPVHDWASHDADAFRYLSLSWKLTDPTKPEAPLESRLQAQSITRQTLGDLRKAHFKRMKRGREFTLTT